MAGTMDLHAWSITRPSSDVVGASGQLRWVLTGALDSLLSATFGEASSRPAVSGNPGDPLAGSSRVAGIPDSRLASAKDGRWRC